MGAYSFPVLDSSAAADAWVLAALRVASPMERFDQVAALNELCERLSEAGLRARYPSADDGEIRLRSLSLRLGRALMLEVYGWDPAVQGW
jgi:hypothetical protein